jgi:hypothetical protein
VSSLLQRMLPVAVVLALLGLPARSSAFSDPSMFARSTLAAGGGERWFTGSPADGYSCDVCHEGGQEPRLTVTGLPLAGYRPGASYEVVVTWAAEVEKFGSALEFTDAAGRGVGFLRLPPDSETQSPEFCEPASDGILAAALLELPGGRQIINVPDCGAKRLRFLWTAPARDVGAVWFSGSAVWSDGQADPYHDGVTDFGRVLSADGVASVANTGCSLLARRSAEPLAVWVLAGVCVLVIARRRKRHQ